jgi:hypothetical protein
MVSYQRTVELAFDMAEEQGLRYSSDGSGSPEARELMSVVSEVWQDRKRDLKQATISQARSILEDEVAF